MLVAGQITRVSSAIDSISPVGVKRMQLRRDNLRALLFFAVWLMWIPSVRYDTTGANRRRAISNA
jgi:hypothetical protein